MEDEIKELTLKDLSFAPMGGHKTKKIKINGEYIDIDEKIIRLVECLNDFGIKTIYSCEGCKDTYASIRISNENIRCGEYNGDKNYSLIFPSKSDYIIPELSGGKE